MDEQVNKKLNVEEVETDLFQLLLLCVSFSFSQALRRTYFKIRGHIVLCNDRSFLAAHMYL